MEPLLGRIGNLWFWALLGVPKGAPLPPICFLVDLPVGYRRRR